MSATIGSLRVSLGLDSAQFSNGMNRASKGINSFAVAAAASFAAVAAAGAAAFAAVSQSAARADAAWKSSQSLGIPIEQVGRLRYNAEMAGASFETLETGIRKASQSIGVALRGASNEGTKAFSSVGVALKNADGTARSMDLILGDVAERFATLPDGAQKTSLAIAMFGRSGAQLIPMLNQGRDGLAAMGDEAEKLGLVFGERTGRLAERFNDNLARMAKATEGLVNSFGAMLLPAAVAITDAMVAMQPSADAVIAGFAEIARWAGVGASALAGFFAPAVLTGLSAVSVAIGTTMVGAVRALGAAMLANPLGLLIGGIAAAVTAAFMFRDEIKQVIGVDVVEVFKTGANLVTQSFDLAFRNIGTIWGSLPVVLGDITITTANAVIAGIEQMINGAIGLINDFTRGAREALGALGIEVGDIGGVGFGQFENKWSGAIGNVGAALAQNLKDTGAVDYVGGLTSAIGSMWATADGAAGAIAGLNDELEGAGGGGGGGGTKGAASAAKAATDDLSESMKNAQQVGQQLASTLASGFSDMFKGLIRGTKSATEAIGDLLGRLGDLFIDNAFNMLFGGMSGGLGNMFGGLFGGFRANGGPISAGKGYIVGERGPEFIVPRSSGMVIPNHQLGGGGGATVVQIMLDDGLTANIVNKAVGQSVQVTRGMVEPVSRAVDQMAQQQRYA